jgi:hypothetical protein
MLSSTCSIARNMFLLGAIAAIALAPTSSTAQDPPGSARLAHLQGNVSVQPNGEDAWGQASSNMPMGPGDRVYTDPQAAGAQAAQGELQAGPVRSYFSPGSDLTLTNMNDQGVELGLAQGSLLVSIDGFRPGESLFISTPNGGVTASGAGAFRVDVYLDQQSTVITCIRGSLLQLNGAGDFAADLTSGQAIQLTGTNPVYSQPLEPSHDDTFQHWAANLDTHRFNSVSAQYVSAEMHGYDDLDGNGDWQPQSEYGPIWYPRVEAGWAPYHNGHWVHMPFYGWTWVADEPWGAAPFHYGRWVVLGGRWGWIPGPREAHPVWSPAQVVFAGGVQVGGAGVSVWFPLGPGEPYHPWYPCSPEYVNRVNITNIRETTVIHTVVNYNVVNVTNITYVNRTNGATAMRQQDFASGHAAQTAALKIDPTLTEHIRPAAPAAQAPPQRVILRPVAKPNAALQIRPTLITHYGQLAPATPNAKPVPVPVRPVDAPKPLPGRAAIGAPSVGGKPAQPPVRTAPSQIPQQTTQPRPDPKPFTPAAKFPANQTPANTAPANPQQPQRPVPDRPVPERPVPERPIQERPVQERPAPNNPPAPVPRATTPPPAQTRPQPPAPEAKPANKDNKKPNDKKKEDKKPE